MSHKSCLEDGVPEFRYGALRRTMPTPESFGGYSGIAGFQNSGRKAGDGTDVFVEGEIGRAHV